MIFLTIMTIMTGFREESLYMGWHNQDQDRYLREMYLKGTEKRDLGTRFLESNPHVDTLETNIDMKCT